MLKQLAAQWQGFRKAEKVVSKGRCRLKHRTRPGESSKSMDWPTLARQPLVAVRETGLNPLCVGV